MGNAPIRNKRSLVHFFDGVTGLMQIVIFFLLGLLAFPSQLPSVIVPALSIRVFFTLGARPIAVSLLLKPFAGSWRQTVLVLSLIHIFLDVGTGSVDAGQAFLPRFLCDLLADTMG